MSCSFSMDIHPFYLLTLLVLGFVTTNSFPNCKREELRNVAEEFAYTAMSGGYEYSQQNSLHSNSDSAVDGKKDTNTKKVTKCNCALTQASDSEPSWWEVDLNGTFSVDKVVVSSLTNTTYETDFVVLVEHRSINHLLIHKPSYVDWSKICARISFTEFNCGRRIGRYVWIVGLANKEKPLMLCEVEVTGRTPPEFNLAYNKLTRQSSVAKGALGFLAVDGVIPMYFYQHGDSGPKCIHTNDKGEKYPWWRVDLKRPYIIDRVVLYNRGEGLHHYLHDVEIRIGEFDIPNDFVNGTKHFTDNPLCLPKIRKYIREGKNVAFCKEPLLGQYVSVQIVPFCDKKDCPGFINILVLCEVQVYGETPGSSDQMIQVSRGKRTRQSSTDFFGDSSFAVDGKIPKSPFSSGSIETCVRTPQARHPWWSVSLFHLFVIEEVNIYLPGNGNQSRLHDFEILVARKDLRHEFASSSYKSDRSIVCDIPTGKIYQPGLNRFKCRKPLVGSDIAIRIFDDKRKNNVINLCEVEIMGCPITDEIYYELFLEYKKQHGLPMD